MSAILNRDQLVLVTETIFNGAVGRIESAVPSGIPLVEFDARKESRWESLYSILGTVRNQLRELLRVTGCEAPVEIPQCGHFHRLTEIYCNEKRIGVTKDFPSVKWLAESFVDQYFTGEQRA